MNKLLFTIALISTTAISCDAQENTPKISTPNKINYSYEVFVDSLDIPWGMSFINENDLLVTEKSGILYRIKNGIKKKVKGLPPVYVRGQGGLLDVALSPNYKKTKEIYFTMSSEIDTYNKISLIKNSISDENLINKNSFRKGLK